MLKIYSVSSIFKSMEIILAKTAGYCMGVKRAVRIALKAASECKKPVCTCGPLIHNSQAVRDLEKKGISVCEKIEEVTQGTVIIRAHGIQRQQKELISSRNIVLVDATCPHVLASQKKIRLYSEKGYFTVIAGDRGHPEILSLESYACSGFTVLENAAEAELYQPSEKAILIAQTTFSVDEFFLIAERLKKSVSDLLVFDTICRATAERQQEAREISHIADVMVIVGGKNSANTSRLAQVASESGKPVVQVETATELNPEFFLGKKSAGVTAGASTPRKVTAAVIRKLLKW